MPSERIRARTAFLNSLRIPATPRNIPRSNVSEIREPVPSVLFWQCSCGIEWRALKDSQDNTKTHHSCGCGLRRELAGVVSRLSYRPRTKTHVWANDWKDLPVDRHHVP